MELPFTTCPKGVDIIILKHYLDQFSVQSCIGQELENENLDRFIKAAIKIPFLTLVCKSWREIVNRWILKNWPCHYYTRKFARNEAKTSDGYLKVFLKERDTAVEEIEHFYYTINKKKLVYKYRLGNPGRNHNHVDILYQRGCEWYVRYIKTYVISLLEDDDEYQDDLSDESYDYIESYDVRFSVVDEKLKEMSFPWNWIFHSEKEFPEYYSGEFYGISDGDPDLYLKKINGTFQYRGENGFCDFELEDDDDYNMEDYQSLDEGRGYEFGTPGLESAIYDIMATFDPNL